MRGREGGKGHSGNYTNHCQVHYNSKATIVPYDYTPLCDDSSKVNILSVL